jgi:hypothetical protein
MNSEMMKSPWAETVGNGSTLGQDKIGQWGAPGTELVEPSWIWAYSSAPRSSKTAGSWPCDVFAHRSYRPHRQGVHPVPHAAGELPRCPSRPLTALGDTAFKGTARCSVAPRYWKARCDGLCQVFISVNIPPLHYRGRLQLRCEHVLQVTCSARAPGSARTGDCLLDAKAAPPRLARCAHAANAPSLCRHRLPPRRRPNNALRGIGPQASVPKGAHRIRFQPARVSSLEAHRNRPRASRVARG